jgi:hypothetical protein
MTRKPRSLPDFDARSVALFATLAQGCKPARPSRRHTGERRKGGRESDASPHAEASGYANRRAFDPPPAREQDDGSIPSPNFDEGLK